MDQDKEQENIHVCLFDVIKEHALSCQTSIDRPLANVSVTWSILHYLSVKFSSYGLTGIYNYLQNQDIFSGVPEDNWIVCPIQLDKDGGWDIQIGMSGKSKIGQTPFDGMRLELQEELGLNYIGNRVDGKLIDPPRTLFFVKIGDTQSITEKSRIVQTQNNEDDKTTKLSCFVHGTISELLSVINIKNTTRTYSCTDDNILGLALVSIKTIKNFIHNFIINGKVGKGSAIVHSGRGNFGKGASIVYSDRVKNMSDFNKGKRLN